MANVNTNPVLLLAKTGSEVFSCPQKRTKYAPT